MTADQRPGVNPLSERERQKRAGAIYTQLAGYNRRVFIDSIGNGTVTSLHVPDGMEVNIWTPDTQGMFAALSKRGIQTSEANRGVINVKTGDHCADTFKHIVITDTGKLRQVDVDRGFGVTVNTPDITPDELYAMRAVTDLSLIPRQIARDFGAYDVFKAALGERDMTGIESTSIVRSPLYVDGLDVLVDNVNNQELWSPATMNALGNFGTLLFSSK